MNRRLCDWRARPVAVGAFLSVMLAAAAVWAAGAFTAAGTRRELRSAPGIDEWRFEAVRGPSPFDRIGLHRVARGPKPPAESSAVILYLPGTHMNGQVAVDDPRFNLRVYLATKGYDVWALDYRTHFVPPATPEDKLGEMKDWTDELFESDIDAAADFILSQTRRHKLFVAGFSRGVTFAYLYAAMHPEKVAGLIILDGFIPNGSMPLQGSSGYAIDLGGPHLTFDKRKVLAEMVIHNPDGPAPIPKYKTARENLEHVVYDARSFGGKGGLSNPQGGFADPIILARVMVAYDRWWPAVQNREDSFTPAIRKALGDSKIPVIAFASTNISPRWAAIVKESAQSTGSPDVTFKALDGWGHLDVLCGTKAEAEVYAPVAAWLKQHAK